MMQGVSIRIHRKVFLAKLLKQVIFHWRVDSIPMNDRVEHNIDACSEHHVWKLCEAHLSSAGLESARFGCTFLR